MNPSIDSSLPVYSIPECSFTFTGLPMISDRNCDDTLVDPVEPVDFEDISVDKKLGLFLTFSGSTSFIL